MCLDSIFVQTLWVLALFSRNQLADAECVLAGQSAVALMKPQAFGDRMDASPAFPCQAIDE